VRACANLLDLIKERGARVNMLVRKKSDDVLTPEIAGKC
jgi:hypothetical protein